MNIGQKLLGSFGAILLLTALVASIGYYNLDNVITIYQTKIEQGNLITEKSDALIAEVLQIRQNQKDLLLHRDLRYQDAANEHRGPALKNAEFIRDHVTTPNLVQKAETILNVLASEQHNFNNYVELAIERGLDGHSGIVEEVAASAAYSGVNCPLIPEQSDQRFRSKLPTDSGAK